MNYLEFQNSLKNFPVFSIRDIKKAFPNFDNRRLVEWQHKKYIQKLRREYYYFPDQKKDENFLFFAANKMYHPSYVSMESALAYYHFIPEGVFMISSISSRNTASFNTCIGDFTFYSIKKSYFFGYKIIQINDHPIKMAEPEKALLDFLYLKKLNALEDMENLRLNTLEINQTIDFQKLNQYQKIFQSKTLDKRIDLLKKIIDA